MLNCWILCTDYIQITVAIFLGEESHLNLNDRVLFDLQENLVVYCKGYFV
jgi:hypothetical protein